MLWRMISPLLPRGRGSSEARATAVASAIAASLAISSAEPVAAQEDAGSRATVQAGAHGASTGVEDTLGKIDTLLTRLDAQTKDAWARAEEMLDLADAATDPDEQMRLEEMYGKMAAVASGFEEQRTRLHALRNELAAARDRMPP